MKKIFIYDTTLRDGEQSPGCSMNAEEKLEVTRQLCRLNVDMIEAGFAASSQADASSVKMIADFVKGRGVSSLCRCTEADINTAAEALKSAESPRLHLFLATSQIHMKYKLKMTTAQVLDRISYHIKYAKKLIGDVQFSAEDATRSDRDFLCRAISAAIEAGATVINLPDTVGYATPEDIFSLYSYVCENVQNIDRVILATHNHDDLGMATSNTLSAIRAGATQAECTLNGIGERAGNAALEQTVMALKVRGEQYDAYTDIKTAQIYRGSRMIYGIIGDYVPRNKPIVGKNTFSHEAGIHQHGVMANPLTYEIISPEDIGMNRDNMVLGKHSGRHAFEERISELGYDLMPEQLEKSFDRFKHLADKKKEVTDRDLEAIVADRVKEAPTYSLDRFVVHAGNLATPTCVIRLIKDGVTVEDVSLGDGPVDAAYNAIDKIVKPPVHELFDYAIQSISTGKDALGEVLVKLKSNDTVVSGRGVSTDIIESSILAYLNAINKLISNT